MGGMVTGFDSDGPDIFRRQFEFGMATRIPMMLAGALVAPEGTPLRARLAREGRLQADGAEVPGMPWATNITPRQMTREQLREGMRWLCNKLYDPVAFGTRLLESIDQLASAYRPAGGRWGMPGWKREIEREAMALLGHLGRLGLEEARMLSRVAARLVGKPHATAYAGAVLTQYHQARYMFEEADFWDPKVGSRA